MKYLLTLSLLIFVIALSFLYKDEDNSIINLESKNNTEISQEIKLEISKQEEIKKNQKITNTINNINIVNTDPEIIKNSQLIDSNLIENNSKNNIWDLKWTPKKSENINLQKINYSSNINNIIKFNWNNLDQIVSVKIWEHSFVPELIEWFLYVLVEENNYLNWEYSVFFILKDWTMTSFDKKINFSLSNESLLVTDITPKELKNDIERNIVLQWKWFTKVISIQLSNNIVLKSTSFNIINDNVLNIKIPKNLDIWKYSLNIMNTNWIVKPNIQLTIKK